MDENLRRICVLIHGYRQDAPDWERVMWGNPEKEIYGRITLGIKVAIEERATHVYWGGGKEVPAVFAYVRKHIEPLRERFGKRVDDVLGARSVAGLTGVSTTSEVLDAISICAENNLPVLALVSDEAHLERCYKYALKVRRTLKLRRKVCIVTKESDESFSNNESVLFEPRTSYRDNLHTVAEDLLELDKFLNGNVEEARKELRALIAKLKRTKH